MITLDKVYSLILEASIYDMEKTPRKRRPRAKVDGTPIKGRFNADILKDINYADETSLNQFVKTLVSNEGRDRTSPYYPIRQLVHFFDLQGGAEKTMWGADAKWTLGMLKKLEPRLENNVFTLRRAHKDLIKLIYGKDASAPKGHQLAIAVCNSIKGCVEAADIVVNKINKRKDVLSDSRVWTGDKTGKQLGLGKILYAYMMKKDKLLAVIKKLETIAGNGYNPMSYTSTGKRIMGEAFRAGNRARKQESAADTAEGSGIETVKGSPIQAFMDYYKISEPAAEIFYKAYNMINECDFEPECATKWECLIMLAAMLAEDGNPADLVSMLGYKSYRQKYGSNNPYDYSWFDEPDNILDSYKIELKCNIKLMTLFTEMVDICGSFDITPDKIWDCSFENGGNYFSLGEAFRAGNRARKKESAQDIAADSFNLPMKNFQYFSNEKEVETKWEERRNFLIKFCKTIALKNPRVKFVDGSSSGYGTGNSKDAIGLKFKPEKCPWNEITMMIEDVNIDDCETECEYFREIWNDKDPDNTNNYLNLLVQGGMTRTKFNPNYNKGNKKYQEGWWEDCEEEWAIDYMEDFIHKICPTAITERGGCLFLVKLTPDMVTALLRI